MWPDPLGDAKFDENHQEWKLAIGTGDLDKYGKILKEVDLSESDDRMEATALENGFL